MREQMYNNNYSCPSVIIVIAIQIVIIIKFCDLGLRRRVSTIEVQQTDDSYGF